MASVMSVCRRCLVGSLRKGLANAIKNTANRLNHSEWKNINAVLITKTEIYRNSSTISSERPVVKTTIDEEELRKFALLSQQWWDEQGEFEALHALNQIRIPFVRDGLLNQRGIPPLDITQPLAGFSVLDVGSGGGLLAEPLARLGAFVVGIDAVEENIKIAQIHLQQDHKIAGKVKYIEATVEDMLVTEEENFDAVVVSEVAEHVTDHAHFIECCCRLVKPGGSVFITTLNKTQASYFLGVLMAERVLHLLPAGTHDWNKFIPPEDLQYLLDKNGCVTRLVHGMCYNFLAKKWSWIQNTSINYAVHAVKIDSTKSGTTSESKFKNDSSST
ncbi:hypothetical protein CHS0354_021534 [Potamilus streckersoni]|uniref:Ubiquinone biosynthesis O-methyltransferase, mitochondrial n=1 Tax=Potamilus streckersoni TaxID=2493646 RepID=A0AAE0SNK2_9BIVA|nr:hypothetical protein CHS0354_021534 [Potamilus streckersoni]